MKLLEDYKQWKLDNPDEGYQYDQIHEFFAEHGRGDMQDLLEVALELKVKADRWDKLDAKVGKYYNEDNAEYFDEMGLVSIGEICASHLGYL